MNLVVGFLSMLGSEEEHGGVKRMLGICAEFERIAKVVVDKAEKDSSSRKKRKGHEDPSLPKLNLNGPRPSIGNPTTPASNKQKPVFHASPNGTNGTVPGQIADHNGFSPISSTTSSSNNAWLANSNSNVDFNHPDYQSPLGMTPFADMQGFDANGSQNGMSPMSAMNINSFQQPFVPQDLWQMPMTLEWDWAEMTSGVYSGFDAGMASGGMGLNGGEQMGGLQSSGVMSGVQMQMQQQQQPQQQPPHQGPP